MKILFMGTSPFAVESLRSLTENGYEICGVVTQPDRPKGRGYHMTPTPVKEYALSCGYSVFTPEKLKDEAFLPELRSLDPDLIVVAAYGKILPPYILDYPRFGCVNVHGSLLPRWRGAAPINHALMAGDAQTGITTMYMDAGLDTGDMILKEATPILASDDFGTLHDRMAAIGGKLLIDTLKRIEAGTAPREKQVGETCYASMITKEMRKVDFSRTSEEIFNQIRGLAPEPGAYALCGGKTVKLLASEPVDFHGDAPCGTVVDRKTLTVRTADGAIRLKTVQPEGKKPMSGESFSAGNRAELFE